MVSSAYLPLAAAEFPNDNPRLHLGARWLCRGPLGAPRAVLHYRPGTELVAAPRERAPQAALVRRFEGPLVLDLARVVLPHRVEDVPPPPDFIFQPFVPAAAPPATSSARAASGEAPALIPIRCRAIGAPPRTMGRRVARGPRVDIAPCLSVGASEPPGEPREPRERSEPRFKVVESVRRPLRRRGPLAARAIAPCPLPAEDAVSRAIAELEAAFAERSEIRSALAQTSLPG